MSIDHKELSRIQRRIAERGGPMVSVAPTSPVAPLLLRLERVARSRASVLLWGEPGVGRRTLLRALHVLEGRKHRGPWVRLRAQLQSEAEILTALFGSDRDPALGKMGSGAIQQARGGTLLIENVEDLPARAQAWLCDALSCCGQAEGSALGNDRRRTDRGPPPRLVATMSLDPRQAVEDGDLREDLFYLLGVFEAEVPPLRRRRGDVLAWAQCFLEAANERHGLKVPGFTDDAQHTLARGSWMGNGPELRRAVEHAAVLAAGRAIGAGDLPGVSETVASDTGPRVIVPVGTTAEDAERRLIVATLEHTGYNKAEAARTLALDVKTVRNKLKTYGLS